MTNPLNTLSIFGAFRAMALRPEAAPAAGLVFILILISFLAPNLFWSNLTWVSISDQMSQLGMVAIGVTLLLIVGHFDLSVGAVFGIAGFLVVDSVKMGHPWWLALLLPLCVSAVAGLVNGVIVTSTGLHSFIVTLGTALIFRGLLTAGTQGGGAQTAEFPEELVRLFAYELPGGFHIGIVWYAAVALFTTLLLVRTQTGNWFYAIGQNPQGAANMGVPVKRTTIICFVSTSVLAGLGGIIQAVQYQAVDTAGGQGYELNALAIAVIGGALLTGGYGSIVGTVIGSLVFAATQVGLILARVPGFWFNVVVGVVLVVAVLINTWSIKRLASAKAPAPKRIKALAEERSVSV
ncbi:ABC transporter permease [Acidovorax sp. sic0104]|uniref:ABC transporter permease n=1 Tax=Acidovorax sp. sic0104 TaxID=2854784 RepID=UPI001C479099|nr:ABC transporter permease [Acidovorax sp. sic0104]MBV7543067.1 ABC transporter permease [Acidovorax sp. sic0104]